MFLLLEALTNGGLFLLPIIGLCSLIGLGVLVFFEDSPETTDSNRIKKARDFSLGEF